MAVSSEAIHVATDANQALFGPRVGQRVPFFLISLYKNVEFHGISLNDGSMERDTQISAVVSRTTSELLDQHVRATGVKKGHLVEQALRHHLRALQELPADAVVHPKLVVTRKSGQAILKQIEKGKPSRALRSLLR
jgi:hypothetical protein